MKQNGRSECSWRRPTRWRDHHDGVYYLAKEADITGEPARIAQAYKRLVPGVHEVAWRATKKMRVAEFTRDGKDCAEAWEDMYSKPGKSFLAGRNGDGHFANDIPHTHL